ncbi:hypothetical protein DICSQDRAFT_131518, partial [Dichomitus squalens LYAD-421 SS1]|uniref:uncharacterized protein n=1 Tax=Dichomitus squalens (strain LYAD-421) TaxID=732165 RepID=UPI0004413F08
APRRAGTSKSNFRRVEVASQTTRALSLIRRSETRRHGVYQWAWPCSSSTLRCKGASSYVTFEHLSYQRCLRSRNGFRLSRRRLR